LRTSTERRSCIAQLERVGHPLELVVGGARPGPLRGQVEVIDGAQDVVDVALRAHRLPRGHPAVDRGDIGLAQDAVAMRLDLALADGDRRDRVHVDAPLPVLGVDAEHGGPVLAHAEILLRQRARHAPLP
jgi:hypothetical protein